ncbi:MAG TPA: SURF1 family protein [Rhizobiales bacterium]|nr:SURF1 family protein [Hyphomicrobiales bacterium]
MTSSGSSGRGPAHGFPWLVLIVGTAALAALLALGTWQMHRLAWKEALIATIDQRIVSAPRPLADIERLYATSGDVDYWPVSLRGTFLHGQENHFLATWRGASGYFVYTPLELADGRLVFVNRGFVPFDRKDSSTRPEGQVEGEVEIVGLARNPLAAKPSWIVPDNDLVKNVFYWKDIAAMASRSGIERARLIPFFVDAGPGDHPGTLPEGGVTIIDLPNNHLQYAITWYGLAAALLVVLVVFIRGRLRPRP